MSRASKRSYERDELLWKKYQAHFPDTMRSTKETTPREEQWSWRGLDVHVDRMESAGSTLKIVVLHGAGAYGRLMAPAAVLAKKHGYDTVSPDLPGYGLTRVPWKKFDYPLWVDCVCDLVEREIARDGKPVAIFGVSLGGMLAYHAAAKSRKVVGVVSTTLADTREPSVRKGFARTELLGGAGLWLLDRTRALTDGLPMPMAYLSKMNAISNDPGLSSLCMSDRLGGGNWVPARFLRTFMNATPAIEPEDFDLCPLLLAHPGEDRMTEIDHSQRFFDRLACEKKMVILEGASHMPTERPGVDVLEREVIDFFGSLKKQPKISTKRDSREIIPHVSGLERPSAT